MPPLQTTSGQVDIEIFGKTFENIPLIKFDHVESVQSGSRWKLVFRSISMRTFSVLADSKEQGRLPFRYRFKIDGTIATHGISDEGAEWYRGVIVKSKQRLTATGVIITLLGTDPSILMQGRTRTQPWRVPFPTMVRSIASDYGVFNLSIDAPVEQEPPVYWQYGENDWDFLGRTTRNLVSATGTGRGDYEMWFSEGGILNIKPPGKEGRAVKRWFLSQTGMDWRVKDITVIQRKRALQAQGGLAIMGIGFDPLTKKAITFEHTPETSTEKPRMGKRNTLDATAVIPAMTMRSVADNPADLEDDVKSEYGNRFRRMYLAEAEVMPEFRGYGVGDIITIDMVDPQGESEPVIPGNYLIEARRTKIIGSNIRMKLLLARHGAQSGDTTVKGRNYDTPATERKREGRDRNITAKIVG